jgi:uncharacterized RDD family membrane protein YckC
MLARTGTWSGPVVREGPLAAVSSEQEGRTMQSTGSPGSPPDESAAWNEAPPQPTQAPSPPAGTSPAWLSAMTSRETVSGRAGLAYADIPTRVFAYIIDAIILSVGFFVIFSIFGALFFATLIGGIGVGGLGVMAFVWLALLLVVYAVGSAIYFVYTWTTLRASPGQKILGLETLNAADGAVLTQSQAIRRWLFLFGPSVVATVLSFTPFLGGAGSLLGLVIWAYVIFLLYTAASSPTRQAFHDVQASTVVVKVGR